MRYYSLWDQAIFYFDKRLRASALASVVTVTRISPAESIAEAKLSEKERKHAAGLMRVNHVGEVCAQALYQGQAFTARSPLIKKRLQQAATEERDHLQWCQQRLEELNSHTSYSNPFWYSSACLFGLMAGLLGDRVSLGFLAETEHQVARHLKKHLLYLPLNDNKSRAIVEQMCLEEMEHASTAEESGAIPLPLLVQWAMQGLAKFMTVLAYYV